MVAYIAMKIAVTIKRENDVIDQRSTASATSGGAPQGKAKIFLKRATAKVLEEVPCSSGMSVVGENDVAYHRLAQKRRTCSVRKASMCFVGSSSHSGPGGLLMAIQSFPSAST